MNLLLLSGGMDSALCLHRYGAALAIGFDYGQEHVIELRYADRLAAKYGVPFEFAFLPMMPRVNDVVFAGRNAVMLASAASLAQSRGLKSVTIGCNLSDAERFADCRPEFIEAMSQAFEGAYGVSIKAPLLGMHKAEIVAEARSVGLPPTWTCYHPVGDQPCGICYSCKGLQ